VASRSDEDDADDRSMGAIPNGTIIDQYQIIRMICGGGMSEVYLAQDNTLDRNVALKFLPPFPDQDPASHERLVQEARAASRLNHPNIITIHGIGKFKSRDFIVMEYIEGRSLRQAMESGPVPVDEIIQIASQVGDALRVAH